MKKIRDMVYQEDRIIELLFNDTFKGYNFYILNLGTHPTAYVEIPKGNVLYEKNYFDIGDNIKVHGGLTYSSHVLLKNDKDKMEFSWFIGWDYAHYGDYLGYDSFFNDEFSKKWTTKEIIKECENVIKQIRKLNNET